MKHLPLWSPDESHHRWPPQIVRFQRKLGVVGGYPELHDFSVQHIEAFWSAWWDEAGVIGHKGERVLIGTDMLQSQFFPDATLNFAENLLRFQDSKVALVGLREDGYRVELTYRQLYEQVQSFAGWLRSAGVRPGDRVAAYLPNIPETVVVMLAAASVGAIFSSCSPDFGVNGVLDRFGQITPKVLVTCDGYRYDGKTIELLDRVAAIRSAVESIEQVAMVDILGLDMPQDTLEFSEVVKASAESNTEDFNFEQLPFNHPLYILYSSGTTGTPKCIVHGAGGTLLQHTKEHRLHVDLTRDDVLFYFTTCGWMMWNWLVSGLATGATLVLFDGSPFHPSAERMMTMAEEEGVTVFGTSAKYLSALEKSRVKPRQSQQLQSLRMILSTGSPLSHESFRYVYRDISPNVCLASISGGTDIVSCFVLGNPALPVFEGQIQCAGLGMDVRVFDETGASVYGQKGELVCCSPFPSMPVRFWGDETGERYRDAYFSRFLDPLVWSHGDYAEVTDEMGYIIHGRSDAVLNPGGVRIGTAEIYRQVEKVEEILDAICVGQEWRGDVRVILFVVLRDGVVLDQTLRTKIRDCIRDNATPRHVPARILKVPDVPRTLSGKLVELAVRNVIHGRPVTNTDALANPEALEHFRDIV